LKLYHRDCLGLHEVKDETIHAIITDPPYGIGFQNHDWDKQLPNPKIWDDCFRVLRPGAYACVFSSVRLMHRLMVNLEDSGFRIKDVLFWVYLNGMPKTRDIALEIDEALGIESEVIGKYNYVQGYRKGGADHYKTPTDKWKYKPGSDLGKFFEGSGLGIKPAYEPIILVQKPMKKGLNITQNLLKYGTGVLNLEETRIPYEDGEGKVGHNPHPKGRVTANLLRTESWEDGYDKFFLIPKVRQSAEEFNHHPTLKPVNLMQHLVKLISFPQQIILDPFMGSGSTGVACLELERSFIGYEIEEEYLSIARKRLAQ
jgi:site-specific DNA-methyltransferase (adenine-specific)